VIGETIVDLPEAEEVPDLLLTGFVADALDVDGVGHDCGVSGGNWLMSVDWFEVSVRGGSEVDRV
jgi:hypothetical protein